MTLEPTLDKRTLLQDLAPGKLALVQFMVINEQSAFANFISVSQLKVAQVGGQRRHAVRIDQILAGGELPFQAITVDLFPSKQAVLTAFEGASTQRQAALSDIYALVVRPSKGMLQIVKALGFLAPLFGRLFGTTAASEISGFAEIANPEKGPVPETIAVLKTYDQTTPFYMMNLNKYYPIAEYQNGEKISGENAYNRYAARIAPYLISVGGYPDILGHIEGVFVGDESSSLHDDWSDFAMVYYPSRGNFMRMMTNTPKKGAHHRDAGLQRAVLMTSSDFKSP